MPDLPTVAETGIAGFQFYSWYGLWAPGGTPREIVLKLNQEANRLLNTGDLRDMLTSQGFAPQNGSPEEFATLLRDESASIGQIVREANIKAE